MTNLQGKGAIITGAGSGFGEGIANLFAEAGAFVGVLDIDAKQARRSADQINAQYEQPRALAITANVTDMSSIEKACIEFIDAVGHLDIWINNAGVALTPQALEDVTLAGFESMMAVNTQSIFLSSKVIVPIMKQQQHGCILNIASTAGVSPRPNLTWYNASKGWAITATKSMAIELAPHNIRVNAINPVAGETPLLATFMGEDTPEVRERFLSSIPLGRFSTPRDIAQAALFLCSDAASLITGVALEVDGGRCI